MSRFNRQLILGIAFLVLSCAVLLLVHRRYGALSPAYPYLTGWGLFIVILFLSAYNGRKKLPFLPLGSSETWLQVHVYLGLATAVIFLFHIRFRVPTGWFEGALAWLYGLVMLSGIFGLAVTRFLPRRLTARGGEVIYEKIPGLRHDLRQQAEAIALGGEQPSTTLAEFYARRLDAFFAEPRNFVHHLAESRRPLNALVAELEDLRRYQAEKERVEQLLTLVRQKDALDYHRALQSMLKLWLFVHLPLTWSLLIFSLVHIALVYGFAGGIK
ncbi:MAG TPA: hypothetical protein VN794_13540 [Methylomirabilota bacterium]|jgi:hypothetical protein|nr:hypothetical protein [Methylomirabilota bacterium]